jgi:peptidoglycan/xylan/chitin deacetylase (PgdA/CDA1 family)
MVIFVVALVAAVITLAHTAPFPFLLEAFNPSRSLWRVKPTAGATPMIYLTFDDGPNPAWTPPLLDALRDTGARATFFLIDEHITDATAPIVRRIADEGHAIGLHSGSRRPMAMSPDTLATTLQTAASRIATIAGRPPCRLFRPHAGWRSGAMYSGLRKMGYQLAGWTWGMWDFDWWHGRDAKRLATRLARKASPGDIVVIHDGHHKDPTRDRRHAGETVRLLVPVLQARGFTFEPLCGTANDERRTEIENDDRQTTDGERSTANGER